MNNRTRLIKRPYGHRTVTVRKDSVVTWVSDRVPRSRSWQVLGKKSLLRISGDRSKRLQWCERKGRSLYSTIRKRHSFLNSFVKPPTWIDNFTTYKQTVVDLLFSILGTVLKPPDPSTVESVLVVIRLMLRVVKGVVGSKSQETLVKQRKSTQRICV